MPKIGDQTIGLRSQLAGPDGHRAPAGASQRDASAVVPLHVLANLLPPKMPPRLRKCATRAVMSVPETAVNKNNRP
jgi:hypothetical protein